MYRDESTPTRSGVGVTAIDLFCGAGGFSLGALMASIDVLVAVDNDRHACATYRQNLIEAEGVETLLLEEDLATMDFRRILEQVPRPDILIGGPPCQGFSTLRIKNAGVGDVRNELLNRYFDVVRAARPKLFLVENVPGLLRPRHAEHLSMFLQNAEEEDYLVLITTVDAQDYGVPQRRKRVFMLGVHKTSGIDIRKFPLPPKNPVSSCESAFAPAEKGDENDVHMRHGPEVVEALKRTPPNGGSRKDSGRVLACHKKHNGHKDVYGRIDPSKVAPTMTTYCTSPSCGRFVHPTEPHGITVRQAARLQGFPDRFVFTGGLTAAGRQIGNAVPPPLAHHLLTGLRELVVAAR